MSQKKVQCVIWKVLFLALKYINSILFRVSQHIRSMPSPTDPIIKLCHRWFTSQITRKLRTTKSNLRPYSSGCMHKHQACRDIELMWTILLDHQLSAKISPLSLSRVRQLCIYIVIKYLQWTNKTTTIRYALPLVIIEGFLPFSSIALERRKPTSV